MCECLFLELLFLSIEMKKARKNIYRWKLETGHGAPVCFTCRSGAVNKSKRDHKTNNTVRQRTIHILCVK